MSTTHETPVVAAPVSTVETAVPTSMAEPMVDSAKPITTTEPAITEPTTTDTLPITETAKDTKGEELAKVEATPITSGNLGYKTGPLK